MTNYGYTIVIEALPVQDGGGYLATVPDLPGCMSDGETYEEAAANVQDAISSWLETTREMGREVPIVSSEYRLKSA